MGGFSGYGNLQQGTNPFAQTLRNATGGKGGQGGTSGYPPSNPIQGRDPMSYVSSPYGGAVGGDRAQFGTQQTPPQQQSWQPPMGGKGGGIGYGGAPSPYGFGGAHPAYGIHNQFMGGMMNPAYGRMPGQIDPSMMGPGQQQAAMQGLASLGGPTDLSMYPGLGAMPTLPEPASQTAQDTIQRVFNRDPDRGGSRDGPSGFGGDRDGGGGMGPGGGPGGQSAGSDPNGPR